MPKNQGDSLYFTLKTKKKDTLILTCTRHYENLRKVPPFSHEKPDILRICLRYKLKQLS